MLRSRNTNVQQNVQQPAASKNNGGADVMKRTAKQQGISNFLIDSTKKPDLQKVIPRRSVSKQEVSSTSENARVTRSKSTAPNVDPCPEYDYDAQCLAQKDEFAIPEYAFEIFAYSRSREKLFAVDEYLHKFSHFTPQIRTKIVDWMVEMQETFELNHETLYLSVKLWDLFMSRTTNYDLHHKKGELIAACCVFVASKFDERSPPLIDDFLYVSEDKFTRQEFIHQEMQLLNTVGYDLGCSLSYVYLRRLARVTSSSMAVLTLSRYILEMAICHYEFVGVRESMLASGAFYLALRMTQTDPEWSKVLHKYSGYTQDEVEPFAEELNLMLHRQQERRHTDAKTVYAKYSHPVFHEVALIKLVPCKFAVERELMKGKPFNFQSPIRH